MLSGLIFRAANKDPSSNTCYCKASPLKKQDEVNPMLWLATRAGKIVLSFWFYTLAVIHTIYNNGTATYTIYNYSKTSTY